MTHPNDTPYEECQVCRGRGYMDEDDTKQCEVCLGKGMVPGVRKPKWEPTRKDDDSSYWGLYE